MGDSRHGAIIWRGDSGGVGDHHSISVCPVVSLPAGTKLIAFGNAVKARSLCNFAYYHSIYTASQTIAAPGVGANTDKKAIIYYRDPSTLEVLHFSYATPIAADIENVGYGNRIKNSAVVAIVGFISTLADVSYIPLYGVYIQRT